WWVFALGALAAFGWMARREIVDDLAAGAPVAVRAARAGADDDESALAPVAAATSVPERPAASTPRAAPQASQRRKGRDELAEDALLDAQRPGSPPA
ncbi:MAG: hypothetical protein J0I40_01880, partial [Cellulomonas sp.]|nr:hypothetical protein [Cellulomonas sp.]